MIDSEDQKEDAAAALKCARNLLGDGLLPGISVISAIPHRLADGSCGVGLVGRSETGRADWHFAVQPHEVAATLRDRLSKEHDHWTRVDTKGECREFLQRAEARLAEVAGMEIDAWGIRTPTSWEERLPILILMVACRGLDTQPEIDRLPVYHGHGLEVDLERMVARHLGAERVAASWKAQSAIGAIDATAAGAARLCGLNVREIMAGLRHSPQFPFECPSEDLKGAFKWKDFSIAATIEGHPGWRLDETVLTLPKSRMPETLTGALSGGRLARLVEIDAMPPDAVIESFEITQADDLEVTLRRDILLIDAEGRLGRPQGPAETMRYAASGSDERSASPMPMAKAVL